MQEDGLKGPLNKFFSEDDLAKIISTTGLEVGDVVFFGAGEKDVVCNYMGKFRIHLSELIDELTE